MKRQVRQTEKNQRKRKRRENDEGRRERKSERDKEVAKKLGFTTNHTV